MKSAVKLDLLAFGAHPDDVELSCSGALLGELDNGHSIGIADLTRGELGTRGDVPTRDAESQKASVILGLTDRCNLNLPDGFIQTDRESILLVIRVLRHYRPEVVLAPAIEDRHPDHGRAGNLISEACFLSGLSRLETSGDTGSFQAPWRPKAVYHYIQDRHIRPDFIVDITPFMDRKMESILAYSSQFYDPGAEEPNTYISTPEFLEGMRSRAREMGRMAGFLYGEGFTVERTPGVKSLFNLE